MFDPHSVVGVKPNDSGVGIGFQVDEFTWTWSMEHFVAWLHIYPGFFSRVSTLTHFLLEWCCEEYSFVWPSSQRLWVWSWFHPQWLSKHQNWMLPLMMLISCILQSLQDFCTWLVLFLIFLNHRLVIASILNNYGALLGHYFCLYQRQAKCQLLRLFVIFPVIW